MRFFRRNCCFEEYNPLEWANKIGDECATCNKIVSFKNCITLCNCYVFSHENCFIKKYNQSKTKDYGPQLRCNLCKEEIQIEFYKIHYLKQIISNKDKIIILAVFIFLLIDAIVLGIQINANQPNYSVVMTASVMMLVLMVFLFLALSQLFDRKYLIKSVKPTNRNVKVSAFEGIITDRQPQTTMSQFSHNSNAKHF